MSNENDIDYNTIMNLKEQLEHKDYAVRYAQYIRVFCEIECG